MNKGLTNILALCMLLSGAQASGVEMPEEAAESPEVDAARIYSTPSERREAGLHRKLNDWLSVSGLVEVESVFDETSYRGGKADTHTDDTVTTLQLGLDFTLSETIGAEFVYEYEVDSGDSVLDEGLLSFEGERLGLEAGRMYIPFGEYYSHFVTGPMLEFGETRGNALVLDVAVTGNLDVFAYGIGSEADEEGRSDAIDWGGGFELASDDEAYKAGINYFSDLAETDEQLLGDFNDVYEQRVPGLNAHLLLGFETFEVTAEYVGALRSFDELENDADRPRALNLEVAWFPLPYFEFAARFEASDELDDQPERQYGLSATWLIGRRINVAIDYLYGEYRNGFVFDDDDNELQDRHQVAAQLSVLF